MFGCWIDLIKLIQQLLDLIIYTSSTSLNFLEACLTDFVHSLILSWCLTNYCQVIASQGMAMQKHFWAFSWDQEALACISRQSSTYKDRLNLFFSSSPRLTLVKSLTWFLGKSCNYIGYGWTSVTIASSPALRHSYSWGLDPKEGSGYIGRHNV